MNQTKSNLRWRITLAFFIPSIASILISVLLFSSSDGNLVLLIPSAILVVLSLLCGFYVIIKSFVPIRKDLFNAEKMLNAMALQQQLASDLQKKFIPLEPERSTGYFDKGNMEFFGYYHAAADLSGDYFNFRKLDDQHYICILCDVSGRGISAALISMITSTLFEKYCGDFGKNDDFTQNKIIDDINTILSRMNLMGKFSALKILITNVQTGKTWICNAGDDLVHYYNNKIGSMQTLELSQNPAAGPFPSEIMDMQGGFKEDSFSFEMNDILYIFTDGIEESRNSEENEFGMGRIETVLKQVLQGGSFALGDQLTFNFSRCKDSVPDSVLALMSVERIFRLNPDPKAGVVDRIMIERKLDDFLKTHFDQYNQYFRYPEDHPDLPEYIYYTHLKETRQYDDFAILAVKLKEGSPIEDDEASHSNEIYELDDLDELEELGVAIEVEELEELED